MENSLIIILKGLLKENKIKVDEKELAFQLQSHPSYPSLHSLTGVLNHFNIQNLALEVPNTEETLEKVPRAFIAYIKSDKKDDLALAIKENGKVQIVYDNKNKESLPIKEFLEIWTGIIVAVEKDEQFVKKATPGKVRFKSIVGFITLVALITLFLLSKPTLFQTLHFGLAFVGLAVGVVIVKHELGFHSKVADAFCSGNIDKVNCDDVLNSKAATFLGYFKLSDVGIVYFMSLILSWILISVSQASFDLVILITVLAIPFTFYSISYQYFVVKKWCLLCLSIVLVLWLQAGILYFNDIEILKLSLDLKSALVVVFSFLFSVSLWQFILPKLKNEQELGKINIEHLKFKRNYNLFNSLLSKSDQIDTAIDSSPEITFGNNDKFLQIVIVTNPLCGHCREVHKLVENILEKGNKELQIIVRFNVGLSNDSLGAKIALRLLEIYFEDNTEKCLKAMHEIYGNVAPAEWVRKWGEAKDNKYMEILDAEKEWCGNNNINFTPEILVNGKSFPREYNRSDLIYFINDIIEEAQESEVLASEVEHNA